MTKQHLAARALTLVCTGIYSFIDGSVSSLMEDVSPAEIVDEGGNSVVVEGLTYANTNDYEGLGPPAGNARPITSRYTR